MPPNQTTNDATCPALSRRARPIAAIRTSRARIIPLVALTTSLALVGCGVSMTGYEAPVNWPTRLLPAPGGSDLANRPKRTFMNAARFQTGTCESIARAYEQLAENRVSRARPARIVGPVLSAIGAGLIAAGGGVEDGSDVERGLTVGGASVALLGASTIVINEVGGAGAADTYRDAANDIRDASDAFIEYLRDAESFDELDANGSLCALRDTCLRSRVGLRPIGAPFGADRSILASQLYLGALCSADAATIATCEPAMFDPTDGAAALACSNARVAPGDGDELVPNDPSRARFQPE